MVGKYDLVIKEGTVVTPSEVLSADVAVKDGKIVAIGPKLPVGNARVLDAKGKYIIPGGIDVHTHLDMPCGDIFSCDDFATGTIAAACGGTTTIIDFAEQAKGGTLGEAVTKWQQKARGKAAIDYSFHIAITDVNRGVLKEIPVMIEQGYPSFKVYMTYDDRLNDCEFLQVLEQVSKAGGLVLVHAENHQVIENLKQKFLTTDKVAPIYHALSRPPLAEAEATNRAIKLASQVDASLYVVHVSCRESLKEIARARENGLPIMAETCPQYLLLSEEYYRQPGFAGAKYVLSPPLRPMENQTYLWDGLRRDNLQIAATDHCPFNYCGHKDRGKDSFAHIPSGLPGIESRLALLFSEGVGKGLLSLQRFVEITATNPAKIFGLYPSKGTIALGSDADIVIFDPELEVTLSKSVLHENVDYTPYEGFKVKGFPVATLLRGNIIYENGRFVGQRGSGMFLERKEPIIF